MAAAVGTRPVPRRSNSSIFSSAWRSRSNRETAGCVTVISAAASVTLPVSIVARKASTCRELIRAILISIHNIWACRGCHYSLDDGSQSLRSFSSELETARFFGRLEGFKPPDRAKTRRTGAGALVGRGIRAEGNAEGSANETRRHVTSSRYGDRTT